MSEPLEDAYFNWLCAKVMSITGSNHWGLLQILYRTEFVWTVPGDANRAQNGIELRREFLNQAGLEASHHFFETECCVLEMFIAFSREAAFQTGTDAGEWFWTFIENLGLYDYKYRHISKSDKAIIEDILYAFVWRTYEPTGHGGMFPMREPSHDQRRVEIWYQFCEYLDDQGLLDSLL